MASLPIIIGGCQPRAEKTPATVVSDRPLPRASGESLLPAATVTTQPRPSAAPSDPTGSPSTHLDGTAQASTADKPTAPAPRPDDRAAPPPWEAGVELLQNSGSEVKSTAGIPSWTTMSGDWQAAPSGTDGIPSFENNAHFVPQSPGPEVDELRQDVAVPAGLAPEIDQDKVTFRLIGHVRSQAGTPAGTARIAIEFLDASRTRVLGRAGTEAVASVDAWTRKELVKAAPPQTRWVRVRLISHAPARDVRPGLFDGLSLRSRVASPAAPPADAAVVAVELVEGLPDWPVPGSGDELLQNPGGDGKAADGLIRSWTSMGGDWVPWDKDAQPLEGPTFFCAGAMKVDELRQDVNVGGLVEAIEAGKQAFRFVGHVRSQPGGEPAQARIAIEFLNESKARVLGRVISETVASLGGWKPVVLDGLAPTRTRWVRVRLISHRGGNAGRALFDDLSLKGSPPTEGAVPVALNSAADLPEPPVPDPDGEELLWNAGSEEQFINGQVAFWMMHTPGWSPVGSNPRPFEGSFSFQPGPTPFARMSQLVDISHLAEDIKDGTQKFRFIGRVRNGPGAIDDPGTAQVVIEFLAKGKKLKNNVFLTTEISSPDGWETLTLPEMLAPRGAEGIRVSLISRRRRPQSSLVMFDDLSLMAIDTESDQDGEGDLEGAPKLLAGQDSPEARLRKRGLILVDSRLVHESEAAYIQGAKKLRPVVQRMMVASNICQSIIDSRYFREHAEEQRVIYNAMIDDEITTITAIRRTISSGARASNVQNQNYAAHTQSIEFLQAMKKDFDAMIQQLKEQAIPPQIELQYAKDFSDKRDEFVKKVIDLKPTASFVKTQYSTLKNDKEVKKEIEELRKSQKLANLGPSNDFKNAARMIAIAIKVAGPNPR